MKKILLAAVALFCMTLMTVSLTSCSKSDNSVEPAFPTVKMADVVKLYTVPQSLYKLDAQDEILPSYVVVDGLYKDKDGNELMYDFSQIIEAKIDENSKFANTFTVDISKLARHGYIKLVPNTDDDGFIDIWGDTAGGGVSEVFFDMQIKNKAGETLTQNVRVKYIDVSHVVISKNVSLAELDEKMTYLVDPKLPELPELELGNKPFERFVDSAHSDTYDLLKAELTDDYKLRIYTIGMPSDPGTPSTVKYTFTRKLVGIPDIVPEEDLILVNFSINVALYLHE